MCKIISSSGDVGKYVNYLKRVVIWKILTNVKILEFIYFFIFSQI